MNSPHAVPRIIHYCWFGGKPLNEMALRCIESWKKYCPDYEIIQWNEENFDISCCDYAKKAYEAKKWAFVSDVARLHALVEHGGIYMDTDVELLKPIDELLAHNGVLGFETASSLQTAFIACSKACWLMKELLDGYRTISFVKEDGSYDLTPNVERLTAKCIDYGLQCNGQYQKIRDLVVYPRDYFSPKDYKTGTITLSPNSYLIHHYDASWYTLKQHSWLRFERKVRKIFGSGLADSVLMRFSRKMYIYGLSATFHKVCKKLRKD